MLKIGVLSLLLSISLSAVAQSPNLQLKEFKNQDAIQIALHNAEFMHPSLRAPDKSSISVVSAGRPFEKKFIVRITNQYGARTCYRDARIVSELKTLNDDSGMSIHNRLVVEKIKSETCAKPLATAGI